MTGHPERIALPQPCAADWAAMRTADLGENADGRYCQKCRRCVTDFTAKPPAEIRRQVREAGGRLCGRLTQKQLAALNQPAPPRRSWRAVLLAVLGAGFWSASHAEATPAPPTVQTPPAPPRMGVHAAPQATVPADTARALKGRVLDRCNEAALPGASVRIEGTSVGAATDAEGRFALDLAAADSLSGPLTLVVSFVGYEARSLPVSLTAREPLTIHLDHSEAALVGEVVMIEAPWYRRAWWWTRSLFAELF